jgi:tetratricopeptide (TPR) repeat protein
VECSLAPRLESAEIDRAKQKPTESLHSYDFYLRGMALVNKRSLPSLPEALQLFKKAFEEDPDFAAAHVMAAWTLLSQQAIGGTPLTVELQAEAIHLANLASKEANDDAFTLARAGHVLTYLGGEYDRGASMVEEAISLNPNLSVAWSSRGWVSLMCGEADRAIESFNRMLRLSPLDPLRVRAWNGISFALFLLGRFNEGCDMALKSIQILPDAHSLGAYIANAMRAGREAEAQEAAARLVRLQPYFRASYAQQAFPIRGIRDRIAGALREAGVPD